MLLTDRIFTPVAIGRSKETPIGTMLVITDPFQIEGQPGVFQRVRYTDQNGNVVQEVPIEAAKVAHAFLPAHERI